VGDLTTRAPVASEAPEPSSEWQEGSLVAGRYRLSRLIGRGGMGKVYLATDEMLNRPIALKRIPAAILFDGDARDDMRQEANRLLDLAHENIVRIHTYYDGPTWPFIAMEYLEGPTLKELLRGRRQHGDRFAPEEVITVARHVCRGLEYAHSKGVVHRDLKPGNLMLAAPPAGRLAAADVVKITDFGISRVIHDSTLRQTGKASGTLPYMSPEQFRGEVSTVRSDIYSLACSLYELLNGMPPFHTGDVAYQIVHVRPKPLVDRPKPMCAAIQRGLAKDPRQRFATVDEFLAALEGKKSFLPGSRASGGRLAGALRLWAVAALVLALGFVVFFAGVRRPSDQGSTPAGGSSSSADPVAASSVPSAQRAAGAAAAEQSLAERVREALEVAFPLRGIGCGGVLASAEGLSRTLSISAPSSASEKALFDGLFFQCYRVGDVDEPKVVATVEGGVADQGRDFVFSGLRDGLYSIMPYASEPGLRGVAVTPAPPPRPLFREAHRFKVDCTPPEFRVALVDQGVLVMPPGSAPDGPGTVSEGLVYSTFDHLVDVQLAAAAGVGDIKAATWRLDTGGSLGPPNLITDLSRFKLKLPPGVRSTYRVQAEDHHGNRSAEVEVTFECLRLEVAIELAHPAGVTGNVASLKGILRVQGDEPPDLRYLVNGEDVEPEPGSAVVSPSPGVASGELASLPFAGRVRLPKATNNEIEVRYSWKGGAPKPFALPGRIYNVSVAPPRLVLADIPTRVRETSLKLEGSIEPYFEGLDVAVGVDGRSSFTTLHDLHRTPGSETARFSHDLGLWPGQEHAIRFSYSYRGDKLPSSQLDAVTVVCDQEPPGLKEPVHFDRSEEWLYVTVVPSEPLARLRLQSSNEGAAGAWNLVDRLPGASDLRHRYITRRPEMPVSFRLELTDLARNVQVVEAWYTGSLDAGSPAAEVAGASRPERAVTRGPGGDFWRAPFLVEMGLEFRPFGFGEDRLEMSLTEVPERPWHQFLREMRHDESAGPGRLDYPMLLGKHPPELLFEFVEWFEEKADDGWNYFIPSVNEWQAAFAGASDPVQAHAYIEEWFRGERRDQKRFDPDPLPRASRYGQNIVHAIGSRRVNATPTGLLDMESNVQEVVLRGGVFYVVGAQNRVADTADVLAHCLQPRRYSKVREEYSQDFTGFRLCRKAAR
jgi:hypothetical protein